MTLLLTPTLALLSSHLFSVSLSNPIIPDHSPFQSLPNSCVGESDGDTWLLLSQSSQSYKPVQLSCNNQYVILDVYKDPNLVQYFSSFQKWHYAIGGPANSDPVNWNEWFLPYESLHSKNYIISPDCKICDESADKQVFDQDTSYYMTGNLAKLMWGVIGFNECDFDKDTYQCYNCTSCFNEESGAVCEPEIYNELTTDYTKAGICGVAVSSSYLEVPRTRTMAQTPGGSNHYKPSIGTDSRFCVCYQPKPSFVTQYHLTEEQQAFIEAIEGNDNNNNNDYNSDTIKKLVDGIKELKQPIPKPIENEGNSGKIRDRNGKQTKKINNSNNNKVNSEIAQVAIEKEIAKDSVGDERGGYKGYQRVDGHELEKSGSASIVNVADLREVNTVYLQQKHFEKGTLRIKQSGTYIITENIIFDYGKDNDYWPISEQNDIYPGAGGYMGPYHLGFFAGIAIEADYVTIDLNGKELKMSDPFYYQQRWFAIIELGNQQFLPGQGPAYFGPESINIQDVTIKNGILGLTSHMAIHGNFPNNIRIENVHIKNFNTHGLQLNGWNGLTMNNVEIGPSSTYEYLRGDYAHARIMIQRLRVIESQMIEDGTINKEFIKFDGRGLWTLSDVIDELNDQMNIAYHYALNRKENKFEETDFIDPNIYDLTDNEIRHRIDSSMKQFIQKSGLPSASSVQGMFLNFMGASVFSYAKYTTHLSSKGNLNNIYIHDIKHDMIESIRFVRTTDSGQTFPTPWNSDIPGEGALGSISNAIEFRNEAIKSEDDDDEEEYDLSKFKYIGGVMTDAYLSMAHFSDDWGMLGFLLVKKNDDDSLMKWVSGDDIAPDNWRFGCNQDVMGHSGKGLIGMRIDGVDGLKLSNIRIENLESHSALGSMACGEYESHNLYGEGGHFKQRSPMQVGYSGNNLQGLSIVSSKNIEFGNININNIESHYGEGYGLSLWTANDIKVTQNSLIKVYNVHTGKSLDKGSLTYESYPNRSPEACGFRIEVDDGEIYETNVEFSSNDERLNVVTCSVSGHEVCLGDNEENLKTMYGTYLSDDWTRCEHIQNSEQLKIIMTQMGVILSDKDTMSIIDDLKDNKEMNQDVLIDDKLLKNNYTMIPIATVVAVCAIGLIVLYLACIKNSSKIYENKGWVYAEVDIEDDVDVSVNVTRYDDGNNNNVHQYETLDKYVNQHQRYGTI